MNRIVRKLMPASELPEALRNEFSDEDQVIVTVETVESQAPLDMSSAQWTPEDFRERVLSYKRQNSRPLTVELAVSRIRQLRDEWDDP